MRVLSTFVPLYGQKRKMPNAHLDFSSLLRQASPFRANFPVTHYYKGTGDFAKNGSKKRHGFSKICGVAVWSSIQF